MNLEGFGFIAYFLILIAGIIGSIVLILAVLRLFSIDQTLKQILAQISRQGQESGQGPTPDLPANASEYDRAMAQLRKEGRR